MKYREAAKKLKALDAKNFNVMAGVRIVFGTIRPMGILPL